MKLHGIFKRGPRAAGVGGRANLNLKELFADFIFLQIPEVKFWKGNVSEGVSKAIILPQIFLTVLLRHLLMRLQHRIPIYEPQQFWLADLRQQGFIFLTIYLRINIYAIDRQQLENTMLLPSIPQFLPEKLWRAHRTQLFLTFNLLETFGHLVLLALDLLNR